MSVLGTNKPVGVSLHEIATKGEGEGVSLNEGEGVYLNEGEDARA